MIFTYQFLRKGVKRRMDRSRRRSSAREPRFATVCHAQGWTGLYTTGAERVFERALEKSSVSRLWTRYTATPLPQECRRAGPSCSSRYADPMRVYTRFLLLLPRSFRPLSSEPSTRSLALPPTVALLYIHLLTRPVSLLDDIVHRAIVGEKEEVEGIKNARLFPVFDLSWCHRSFSRSFRLFHISMRAILLYSYKGRRKGKEVV